LRGRNRGPAGLRQLLEGQPLLLVIIGEKQLVLFPVILLRKHAIRFLAEGKPVKLVFAAVLHKDLGLPGELINGMKLQIGWGSGGGLCLCRRFIRLKTGPDKRAPVEQA
jgi:hypothetical protein